MPWSMLQLGWVHLAIAPTLAQTLVEVLVLILWNDIHFYFCHRLLHTHLLRKYHLPHHRSVVPTPWTSYSLHPLEAVILGSVVLIPLPFHDFSIHALLAFIIFNVSGNHIGHSNFGVNLRILDGSRRHHLHHACIHGNYGFMLPVMDQLFKTTLPADAAAEQISQWKEHNSNK